MSRKIDGARLASFLADEIKQWTVARSVGKEYNDEWIEGRIEAYKMVLDELVSGRFDYLGE